MTALHLHDVHYRYPQTGLPLLEGLSLHVEPGEWVTMMGPSGSGKSTIGRICVGLIVPQRGSVQGPDGAVGWMAQNPDDVFVGATVFEDVASGPRNLGLAGKQLLCAVDEALDIVGIARDYHERSMAQLSGGERQLVALAGVLALKPQFMVLDEPASMLDYFSCIKVLEAVERTVRWGCGVLYITHNAHEALWAHRLLVISSGKIAESGNPVQILSNEQMITKAGTRTPPLLTLWRELTLRGVVTEVEHWTPAGLCAALQKWSHTSSHRFEGVGTWPSLGLGDHLEQDK